MELITDASLTQVPSPPYSAYDRFWAGYYIEQHYTCTNSASLAVSSASQKSYTRAAANDARCEPSPTDIHAICYSGSGVGSLFYKSTPLATCNGCTIRQRISAGV